MHLQSFCVWILWQGHKAQETTRQQSAALNQRIAGLRQHWRAKLDALREAVLQLKENLARSASEGIRRCVFRGSWHGDVDPASKLVGPPALIDTTNPTTIALQATLSKLQAEVCAAKEIANSERASVREKQVDPAEAAQLTALRRAVADRDEDITQLKVIIWEQQQQLARLHHFISEASRMPPQLPVHAGPALHGMAYGGVISEGGSSVAGAWPPSARAPPLHPVNTTTVFTPGDVARVPVVVSSSATSEADAALPRRASVHGQRQPPLHGVISSSLPDW
jgi:hypothetical protein